MVSTTPAEGSPDKVADELVNDEIGKQLDLEWDRKKSLEQRAITVITSSGALVTLLFAFVGLVTKAKDFGNLKGWERWPLIVSPFFFVAAALLAILANRTFHYRGLKASFLDELASMREHDALSGLIKEKSNVLEAARHYNFAKAMLLQRALICEVVAVGLVGVSVIALLARATF